MLKAFTLAEIMITLVVIGIISAIIMPIAINNIPDENIMKFKKANSTLYQVIQELVNSDKYYKDGNMVYKPNGERITDATYFCKTLADVLSVKKENCMTLDTGARLSHLNVTWSDESKATVELKTLDENCLIAVQKGMEAEIITSDGVSYYQTNPAYYFGSQWCDTRALYTEEEYYNNYASPDCTSDIKQYNLFEYKSTTDFVVIYKPFCIDVDGINNGEDPFGYGIRSDGKIIPGERAKEWLEKSIQGE